MRPPAFKSGTWLESTVIEKQILVKNARNKDERIHLGDFLTLASIKHAELAKQAHENKGRICFRGDGVKDEQGSAAVFQEISLSPTAIQAANANIAYDCIPGNISTQAVAIRACVQLLLKSKHKTWVRIPEDPRPSHWHKKGYIARMCLLVKALYGHPESGRH